MEATYVTSLYFAALTTVPLRDPPFAGQCAKRRLRVACCRLLQNEHGSNVRTVSAGDPAIFRHWPVGLSRRLSVTFLHVSGHSRVR